MRVYCPELLEQFESSLRNRADWVEANRRELTALLRDPQASTDRLEEMAFAMESTLRGLCQAQVRLRNLIQEKFPFGDNRPFTQS
ncbi:hypothetical protein BS35_008646 [Actinomadura glauciflava]|nr:hypothetical protein [Actinomadura glauciflava]